MKLICQNEKPLIGNRVVSNLQSKWYDANKKAEQLVI